MYSATYLWAKILTRLEEQFDPITVSACFDDAEVLFLDRETLTVYTPSDLRKETILRTFKTSIEEILFQQFSIERHLQIWGDWEKNAHCQQSEQTPIWVANPQYSFDSFIPGNVNLLPLKAARQVAAQQGNPVYNPLYLYGAPGVGKTHLLYAIANEAATLQKNAKIVYVKGDQFTNELVQAILHGETAAFKEKYRKADLLLVDDIQFIAGKEATQEEFFHTFNDLYENGKQIVLASDRPPRDMPTLEARLQGRFSAGVMIRIETPDLDTRKQIVDAKAKVLGLKMDLQAKDYIAQTLSSNVRQIQGSLHKLRALQNLIGMPLTLENIARAISDMHTDKVAGAISPDTVVRYVCRYYGVEEAQLKSKLRNQNIALPRQVAMYLLRQMTPLRMKEIGKLFGKDHSTVHHAIEKVEQLLLSDNGQLSHVLEDIRTNITAAT